MTDQSENKPASSHVAKGISDVSQKANNQQDEVAFRENKAITSVDEAKSVTVSRVKYLRNLLPQEDAHKIAANAEARDIVWKILQSFEDWKQWRFEISRTLVAESYPEIAVGLAVPCFEHLSTAKTASEEGAYNLARNLLSCLISFSDVNKAFRMATFESSIMNKLLSFLSAVSDSPLINQSGRQLLIKNCLLLSMALGSFCNWWDVYTENDSAQNPKETFRSYFQNLQSEDCRCLAALCLVAVRNREGTLRDVADSRDIASLLFRNLPVALDRQDFIFAGWIVRGLNRLNKASDNLKQLVNDTNKKQLLRIFENCCYFRTSELKAAKALINKLFGDGNYVDAVQLKSNDNIKDVEAACAENELRIDFLLKLSDISADSLVCFDAAKAIKLVAQFEGDNLTINMPKEKAAFYEVIARKDFPEISMKYVKYLLNRDITKEDLSYEMLRAFLGLLWNLADQKEEIRKKIAEAGFVGCFLSILENVSEVNSKLLYSERWNEVLIKSMSAILYNTSRSPEVKYKYLEHDAANILVPYLDEKYRIAIQVSLCIAYVVSDTPEAAKMADERGILERLTNLAIDAMQYDDRKSRACGEGFWLSELLDGLCLLATNDANKQKLLDNKVTELLSKLLLQGQPTEQICGLDLLWTLCFDPAVRNTITADHNADIMEPVRDLLQSSENEEVKQSAQATINFIQKWSEMESVEKAPAASGGHIFISYSWKQQETVLLIRNKLLERNYTVWMDVNNMHGGVLDAMAEAVEQASLVLVCFSQSYKESNACRAESKYAFTLAKPIVPIKMESNYKPDGWLGMLVLPLLYVDISLELTTFDQAVEKLLCEIANSLSAFQSSSTSSTSQKAVSLTNSSSVTATAPRKKEIQTPPSHPPSQNIIATSAPPRYSKWTANEVQNWVREERLPSYFESKFEGYDGENLWTLLCIKQESPDFFYQAITNHFGTNLRDILQLIAAFNRLIAQRDS